MCIKIGLLKKRQLPVDIGDIIINSEMPELKFEVIEIRINSSSIDCYFNVTFPDLQPITSWEDMRHVEKNIEAGIYTIQKDDET